MLGNKLVEDAPAHANLFLGGKESVLKEGVGSRKPSDANAGDAVGFGHRGDGDDMVAEGSSCLNQMFSIGRIRVENEV